MNILLFNKAYPVLKLTLMFEFTSCSTHFNKAKRTLLENNAKYEKTQHNHKKISKFIYIEK